MSDWEGMSNWQIWRGFLKVAAIACGIPLVGIAVVLGIQVMLGGC